MNLVISVRAELLKCRRTPSFYLTLAAAAMIPFIYLLDGIFDGLPPQLKEDPFNSIFNKGNVMQSFAIFPLFIVLIATLLPQVEFKNNTWKQVLASPQPKLNIYLAKFIAINLLIFFFLFAYNTFMLVDVIIFHFLYPDFYILNHSFDIAAQLHFHFSKYIALLAMSSIQFWLGLRFKNFVVPVGIGFCCWLAGALLVFEYKSTIAKYNPYSLHLYSMNGQLKANMAEIYMTSVAYAVIFLFLGYMDFRRRRMHS